MSDEDAVRAIIAAVTRRLDAGERLDVSPADELLTSIAATAVAALETQAASLAVHDPASGRLVFVAAAGPASAGVAGMTIDASAGIAGYAFSTGQPLAIADAASDPRFDRTVAEATGYVPSTLLAVPLTDTRGTVGVLEALDRRGGTFTLRDLDVAGAIAGAATAATRAWQRRRDATALLQESLAALLRDGADGSIDAVAIDDLVSKVAHELDGDDPEGRWRLADRIARLRGADPGSIELAVDWLDALLRRSERGPGGRGLAR